LDEHRAERWRFTLGAEVRDVRGVRVGDVADARSTHFVVEDGLLNPTAYAVPYDAVETFDHAAVWLAVAKGMLRTAEPEPD
jgi:hypothetical protein